MSICMIDSLSTQKDVHYVTTWRNEKGAAPIYHVDTPHAFNRVVGYARYINSTSGTVLYRGQGELHPHMLPSGAREGNAAVSEDIFTKVCNDYRFSKYLGLERAEIKGWKAYNNMLIEAVLQHYGAKTYCMDFVDNHWCALWFGLYKFENNHYYMRDDEGNLYIFLYVAETENPCVGGMYIGEETYTVDLRKALPSTFQRPASQHGWIVRKKERESSNLDKRVVGIIEISVANARSWLGTGELLSEENFFPSYTIDSGYRVLLSRQEKSGLFYGDDSVLPQNTIANYHMHDMVYCSNVNSLFSIKPNKNSPLKVDNLLDLFRVLLNSGWDDTTCVDGTNWNTEKPYCGQSASTAILIQKCFGGDICCMKYSQKAHYFNKLGEVIVDLTRSELQDSALKKYSDNSKYDILGQGIRDVHKKNKDKVLHLIENCKKNV